MAGHDTLLIREEFNTHVLTAYKQDGPAAMAPEVGCQI